MQDALSTAPDKAAPLWIRGRAEWSGRRRRRSPRSGRWIGRACGKRARRLRLLAAETRPALRVKLSSVLVYDIAGKGFTRLRGATGFEAVPLIQGENVQARFFVFDRQPSMDRLVPPNPETPLPRGSGSEDGAARQSIASIGMRWAARRRDAERRVAEAALRGSGARRNFRRWAGGPAVGGDDDTGVSIDPYEGALIMNAEERYDFAPRLAAAGLWGAALRRRRRWRH